MEDWDAIELEMKGWYRQNLWAEWEHSSYPGKERPCSDYRCDQSKMNYMGENMEVDESSMLRALEARLAKLEVELAKAVDNVVASCNTQLSQLKERLAYLEGKQNVPYQGTK